MRRDRWWLPLLALAAMALAVFAAGCGDDEDEGSGDSGSETSATGGGGEESADLGTIEEGQLLVGTDTPYEPFEIGQPPDITGYDIEVMNAIAEELGVEVTYQDTGFGTIFRDVAAGQFDTAAAASTIKAGREEAVDFTDPYYLTQQVLLVPAGSDIASTEDLAGAIVGAQDATTGEEYANDETDAAEVRGYPEGPNAISALVTGQVEAVIMDQAVAVLAAEKQPDIEVVEEIPTEEYYGFAVAPDNDTLREAMNEALATIKEDGTFAEIYSKYFDSEPPQEVLEATNDLLTDD